MSVNIPIPEVCNGYKERTALDMYLYIIHLPQIQLQEASVIKHAKYMSHLNISLLFQ